MWENMIYLGQAAPRDLHNVVWNTNKEMFSGIVEFIMGVEPGYMRWRLQISRQNSRSTVRIWK